MIKKKPNNLIKNLIKIINGDIMEKIEKCLTKLQKQNDILFEELGATEEVMNLQVAINQFRNKFDISDKSKMTDSNPGFVQ